MTRVIAELALWMTKLRLILHHWQTQLVSHASRVKLWKNPEERVFSLTILTSAFVAFTL